MDIKGLLKDLPGGNMEDRCVGFSTLDILCGPARRTVDTNTGTLVLVCAL
jgi:hypothetical protein